MEMKIRRKAMPNIIEAMEDPGLFQRVSDVDAESASVAKRPLDRFGLMMKIYDHVPDAERCEVFRDVADKRLAEQGDRGLGAVYR